jgi:hypothetical protein
MGTTTTGRKFERITPDECVAALTAAAWRESISEERYEQAVEAVQALCRDADGSDLPPGSQVPVGEFQAAVAAALGEQRTLIHCMMGSLGTDWTLEGAIALARRDGAQCAWAPHLFRHELAVYVDGEMHRFDARRPEPAAASETTPSSPFGGCSD